MSQTGGHLGSSLGVVELTVALHYVFNTPADPVIWDVSHQARAPPSPGREAAALHLRCSTAPSARTRCALALQPTARVPAATFDPAL